MSNIQFITDGYVRVGNIQLYYRKIGRGQPVVVIHGGPDFDHAYLLPDMDRLSDGYQLIYYDQRGRGKSPGPIELSEVSIEQEIEDLESLRKHLHLESITLLGHSWGGHLAMEYAIRHPTRVSHLILMNTSPASREDFLILNKSLNALLERTGCKAEMNAIASSDKFKEGDPEAVARYHEIYYGTTIKNPDKAGKLNFGFKKEVVLRARAIEQKLLQETWRSDKFNLFPELNLIRIPSLIIHGDYDFIPAECATHIADAIRGSRFILLKDCGHFSYLECFDELRKAIDDFMKDNP